MPPVFNSSRTYQDEINNLPLKNQKNNSNLLKLFVFILPDHTKSDEYTNAQGLTLPSRDNVSCRHMN